MIRFTPSSEEVTAVGATSPENIRQAFWDGSRVILIADGASPNIYKFNPATNSFTSMLSKPQGYSVPAWSGEFVYFFGQTSGVNEFRGIQRYDPASDILTLMNAKLPADTRYPGTPHWMGGKVYLFGGLTGTPSSPTMMSRILVYDPVADSISTQATELPAASSGQIALTIGSKIYLLSPTAAGPGVGSPIWAYDPAADSIATMNGTTLAGFYPGTGVADGNKAYLFGGNCGMNCFVDTIQSYDPQFQHSPSPAFSYAPTAPLPGQTVTFTDASTRLHGTITSRSWNLGDGNTSTQQNPTHAYSQVGTFQVSLTLTDNEGRTNSSTLPLRVYASAPAVASFTWTPEPPQQGRAVQFTDTSTHPQAGRSIVSWSWTFGDGAASTDRNPSHVFVQKGNHTVTLRVTDDQGIQSPAFAATLDVVPAPPTAAFTFSPPGPRAEDAVQFTDASQPPDGLRSWSWDFGDGRSSSARNPVHAYAEKGTYSVKLRVVTDEGGSASTTRTVAVSPRDVGFFLDPAEPRVGDPIQFRDTSPNPTQITSRAWDFGDGATGTGANPTHTYALPGDFVISLTITREDGSTSTWARSLLVRGTLPHAALSWEPLAPATSDTVRFYDNSTGDIGSWSWNFGDGFTSRLQHPLHRYANPGDYTVRLEVGDGQGSSTSTAQATIHVVRGITEPPVAQFSWRPYQRPGEVWFEDESTDADGSVGIWVWDFGDGEAVRHQAPVSGNNLRFVHKYPAPGEYAVFLTVVDNQGARTTVRTLVTAAGSLPVANFSWQPEGPLVGREVTFRDASTDADGLVQRWTWDFGSGSTASGRLVKHAFDHAGAFPVTLTVVDDSGFAASQRLIVIVASPPTRSVSDPEQRGGGLPAFDVGVCLLAIAAMAARRRPSTP